MVRSLELRNFTVFAEADLEFSPGLNVVLGENGTGKSHLLRVLYSALSANQGSTPTKASLQQQLAERLNGVFRPDSLGRLVRRRPGRTRCEIAVRFGTNDNEVRFNFATNSQTEVVVETVPAEALPDMPVFLPTRELLTVFPGFVALYEERYVEFEENWRDLCLLLQRPGVRGRREEQARALLEPIERAIGGKVELDQNGRFYLNSPGRARLELPLVAEGHRKLAMIARLVATGSLLDQGVLCWDEPEASLNPRLVQSAAGVILALAGSGVQVILATHSLFLMRELDLLLRGDGRAVPARFFGLAFDEGGAVEVSQGPSIDDIPEIVSLDEELAQSERYLAAEHEG